jgi:hypothetical protein
MSISSPMNKISKWWRDKWQQCISGLETSLNHNYAIFKRLILDNYAIYILVFVIIVTLIFIIWYGINPLLVILAPISSYIYLFAKDFRQKILFNKSGTSPSSNEAPKVLFWILDGCNIPAFLDVAKMNPDLGTLFDDGYFVQCVTIFPSITPAAHSTLMTGCYPAKTRVPAFDWVELTPGYSGSVTKEYVRVMPDFKRYRDLASDKKARQEFFHGLGDAMDLNRRYLSPMVTTIFEARNQDLCTSSVTEWIHRGADRFVSESITNLIDDLGSKKLITNDSMIGLLTAFYKEASYEYEGLIWGAEGSRPLADLMVYWKSGTDTMSHEHGPDSFQVRQQIDEAIDKLSDTIRFYKMHSNLPLYVIISADHSQSIVTAFSNLPSDFKETIGKTHTIAGREDLTDTALINGAEIILANNDRAAFFYVFGDPVRKDETLETIMDFLKQREDVDLIFYKENSTIQVIQVPDGGPATGPLDISIFFYNKERLYPHAVERMQGLMNGDKWGDIVISIKEGYSMNPEFKPLKEGEEIHRGDHGGLNANDSLVPLLIWGPAIKSNLKDGHWKTFRTVDIAPTIAAIFKDKHQNVDGQPIEEIFLNGK